MPANDIDQRVRDVIVEHLGVEKNQVVDTATFTEDLAADSLDSVDLLMAINETFGIRIPAEDLADIHTVRQMIERVKAAL